MVDREDVADRLAVDLSGQALHLSVAHDPAIALWLVGRRRPDILVLGPVLGRLDAIGLLEVLREHEPPLPVIVGVGVADGQFAARVTALEPAAVIHHPYRPEQLLRLVQSFAPPGYELAIAPLPIDLGRLRIDGLPPGIEIDGVRVMLPRREYLLLRFLAERVGRVVPRADIAAAIWGTTDNSATNSLAVHIMRLRRRLDAHDRGTRWITAVRGIGYLLTIPQSHDRST